MIYGSGIGKVGQILGIKQEEAKKVYDEFWKANYSLGKVMKACINAHDTRGFVKGIDGRKIITRSSHSAMNALFQSCGSITVKRTMVMIDDWIREEKLDIHQLIFYHDEVEFDVNESLDQEMVQDNLQRCFIQGGEYYNLRVPLGGDCKFGNNWAEVH